MYRSVTGDYATPESDIEEAQREKVYEQDWSILIKEMQYSERDSMPPPKRNPSVTS